MSANESVAKAERTQALKAFLIPSGLFVACLFNAAGIYIVYTGNTVGIVFLGIGFSIITAGLIAFITFQNKARAKGRKSEPTDPEPYMPPTAVRKRSIRAVVAEEEQQQRELQKTP